MIQKRAGRRPVARRNSGGRLVRGSEGLGSDVSLAELKEALKARDKRVGYVPNRTPFPRQRFARQ